MAAAHASASKLRYVSEHDGSALSTAPPLSGTTTGTPHAAASATARPNVSYGHECTSMSALASALASFARILLEVDEIDVGWRPPFEPLSFGAVTKEKQRGVFAAGRTRERVDDDIPALLEREAPDTHQEGARHSPREFTPASLASSPRMEEADVHPEGHVDDALDPGAQ